MKKLFSLVILTMILVSCSTKGTRYTNPLDIKFGDPYVLLASDGHYYRMSIKDGKLSVEGPTTSENYIINN